MTFSIQLLLIHSIQYSAESSCDFCFSYYHPVMQCEINSCRDKAIASGCEPFEKKCWIFSQIHFGNMIITKSQHRSCAHFWFDSISCWSIALWRRESRKKLVSSQKLWFGRKNAEQTHENLLYGIRNQWLRTKMSINWWGECRHRCKCHYILRVPYL